ncbi:MAG TPA: cytochrome c [Bryobacteraceae bacterium]|nr:cytochrome c [Bryobacteraceae bacterium]
MRKRIAIVILSVVTGCAAPGVLLLGSDSQPVHSITLPQNEPKLPDAPGRKEFAAQCRTCHSPRYVTAQPPFSRKVWEAEVTKMMKVYGAPVPAAQVTPIVDYLVTLNGLPEEQKK